MKLKIKEISNWYRINNRRTLLVSTVLLVVFIPLVLSLLKYQKTRLKNCEFKFLESLPENSSIVVGHAYGRPSNKSGFISKNLEYFLAKNQDKIKNVLFTGDVFRKPSKEQWSKLYSFLDKDIKIIIAPGNHDVGSEQNRQLFNISVKQPTKFPFIYDFENFRAIIDDSTINSWQLSNKIVNIANQVPDEKTVLLLRHNIAHREFLPVVNSKFGLKKTLPSLFKTSSQFQREIVFIAGDGGAFPDLPRFFCKKRKNITYIINGLGSLEDDIVLVLANEMIYKYRLN